MHKSPALSLILALAATVFGGCTEKQAPLLLKVEAVTNQGEPVSGAVVALDSKALGETDLQGGFKTDLALQVGTRPRLEVRKDSETYYFAPYFETFEVTEGMPSERVFKAVLYFVPKPKPEGDVAAGSSNVQVKDEATTPEAETAPATADDMAEQLPTGTAEPLAGVVEDDLLPVPETTPETTPGAAPETTPEIAAKAPAEPVVADPVVEIAAPEVIAEATAVDTEAGTTPPTPPTSGASVAPPPAVEAQSPEALVDVETPVALASVAEAPTLPVANEPPPPAVAPQPTVVTIHAASGNNPIADVEVTAIEDAGGLQMTCTTNERGRCVVRFPEKPAQGITVVASKKGFKTASHTGPVTEGKGLVKLDLERGYTVDIYAVTKSYNHTVGLKDVEVLIDGKRVGETDKFGRYSHTYEGKAEALMAIGLKPRGFLPETYETDFVASGPMKLVKYFTPAEPPAVRMTVVPSRPAGKMDKATTALLATQVDETVRSAARKHVFSTAAFKEYPLALYERTARRAGKPLSDLLKAGWQETDLKTVVDALLVPTVIVGDKPALELSVVDSEGRVIAGAREDLETLTDSATIDRTVAVLAKKITRSFPFEGAVTGKNADKVVINVGYAHGRGIKAGDVLDVYGMQAEKLGLAQLHRRIAQLTVREVFDAEARGVVSKLLPRATIERGDLVVLKPRRAPDAGSAEIRVAATGDGKTSPLGQANVYFNDQWIGATDESGRLYLDASGSGTLRVVKQGFAEYVKPITLATGARFDLAMKREAAFLRIESKPSGLAVKIDGKVVGKTPLATPIAVPTGFVKLELDAPSGFKPYSAVLELDQGTLDLSGARAVTLETDLRAKAQRLVKAGQTDEAIEALKAIPKEHSDYLLSRHELGELYLTVKNEPALAAAAFGEVTADDSVKQFADKRFIGSHINEGIALYMTAERLQASQPETARAHYQKSIEVLEGVVPYLRFVPADQYAQSVHNVDYHRALARHKLWLSSKDPRVLADAVRTWRTYLDGSARSVPAATGDDTIKAFVDNAQVYFKQATASMNAARQAVKQ